MKIFCLEVYNEKWWCWTDSPRACRGWSGLLHPNQKVSETSSRARMAENWGFSSRRRNYAGHFPDCLSEVGNTERSDTVFAMDFCDCESLLHYMAPKKADTDATTWGGRWNADTARCLLFVCCRRTRENYGRVPKGSRQKIACEVARKRAHRDYASLFQRDDMWRYRCPFGRINEYD